MYCLDNSGWHKRLVTSWSSSMWFEDSGTEHRTVCNSNKTGRAVRSLNYNRQYSSPVKVGYKNWLDLGTLLHTFLNACLYKKHWVSYSLWASSGSLPLWPWPWWDNVGYAEQSPGSAWPPTGDRWSAPSSGGFPSATGATESLTLSVKVKIYVIVYIYYDIVS